VLPSKKYVMKTVLKFFTAAILCTAFVACDKDDEDDMVASAKVMVVHASPNAPNVDVRINNSLALSNVAYPNNSAYTELPAGTTNVKVAPAGTSTNVIDANVTLEGNRAYSVFAIDSVAKIKAAVVADDLTAPAAGKAHVRFFHFASNAPAVDIAVANGAVLFANRSFNDQGSNTSAASFTPLNAGSYNLQVRLAGTNTVVLSLPGVVLTEGKIYTVFAKGFLGGAGNQALGAQIIMNN
jgi:hypothetical protein